MKRKKRDSIFALAVLTAFLCVLAAERDSQAFVGKADSLVDISHKAGDMLERNLLEFLDRTLPILSTSFVNLDNLKETSALGRLIGEQIASRFSQHGYKVIELRLSNGKVLVQEKNGELALSREMSRLNREHAAQAIIVGTYCIIENRAFLSTRLVSTLDNSILSSYSFSVKMDELLKSLAQKNLPVAEVDKKTEDPAGAKTKKSAAAAMPDVKDDPISNGSIFLELSNPLAAKIVQSQLFQLGYYTSRIDGIWKKYSQQALVAFKKERNLPNAENWDMQTQMALFSIKR